MPWSRDWNGVCNVYSQWDADGEKWTVEDLHPDDDKLATELMITDFIVDEPLCTRMELPKDEASIKSSRKFWDEIFSGRTSLACYRYCEGNRELVAVNACPVKTIDDPKDDLSKVDGAPYRRVIGALIHMENTKNLFKELGVDKLLSGSGLVVKSKYRGARLGAKVLNAREQLCEVVGIRATSTVFTAPASQKLAARCGFRTLLELSFAELADAGLYFPGDQSEKLKLMVKKYN